MPAISEMIGARLKVSSLLVKKIHSGDTFIPGPQYQSLGSCSHRGPVRRLSDYDLLTTCQCDFALLTHDPWRARDASHFSIAPCNPRCVSVFASLAASACFVAASLRVGYTVDLGVGLRLDQRGVGFLHTDIPNCRRASFLLSAESPRPRVAHIFTAFGVFLYAASASALATFLAGGFARQMSLRWRYAMRRHTCPPCLARRRFEHVVGFLRYRHRSHRSHRLRAGHRRVSLRRAPSNTQSGCDEQCNHQSRHVFSLRFKYGIGSPVKTNFPREFQDTAHQSILSVRQRTHAGGLRRRCRSLPDQPRLSAAKPQSISLSSTAST